MEDETDISRGQQRARLTCTPCHRRKIRCNKHIPCDSCIRRGVASLCSRGRDVGIPTPTSHAHEEEANDTVQTLLQRVAQLEARIDHGRSSPELHRPGRTAITQQTEPVTPEPQQPRDFPAVDPTSDARAVTDDIDAATVLEFLAWGRKKDSDFLNAPEHEAGPRQLGSTPGQDDSASVTNILTDSTKTVQLDVLEALLPSKNHIMMLVEFHNTSLLWYHGSYSSKIVSDDLQVFLHECNGDVRHSQLNLQWLALLFSILTGSITCASPATYRAWGFSNAERPTLALRWYEATVTCLNMANYIQAHTIYSVQAIATLTIAAHILGQSNSQSVLLASAGRIAQSLGLQRLQSGLSNSPDQIRKSEAAKRVFIQLCTQDWFSIPFSETYSLNPRFISSTIRPINCNDNDMVVYPESIPTQASYCNYRYDIAALMPQLLDAMAGCNTLFTKYEQVLKFDDKMRKLATASMPTFLSSNAPVVAEWPIYVSWARRSLTICAAHKIIMIHRKFVGLSFTNSAFSFTRRTCLAASKTILREAFAATDEAGPVLWIDQAFSVAAGIILSLDTLHRTASEPEFREHTQLVSDTIQYLRGFEHSKIASRGVQLLSFLHQEFDRSGPIESRKRPHDAMDGDSTSARKRTRELNMQSVIRDASQSLGVTSPFTISSPGQPDSDGPVNPWDIFNDLLPLQTGFDGQYLFDNFFPEQLQS